LRVIGAKCCPDHISYLTSAQALGQTGLHQAQLNVASAIQGQLDYLLVAHQAT
jgi:hypothetical protein